MKIKSLKNSQEALTEAFWVACWLLLWPFATCLPSHPSLHTSPILGQMTPQWASPHTCSSVLQGPTIWQSNSEQRYCPIIPLPTYLNSLSADFPPPSTWISGCHPCMQSLAMCHPEPLLFLRQSCSSLTSPSSTPTLVHSVAWPSSASVLLHRPSQVFLNHPKNPEINKKLANVLSPIPWGSSTLFKHYLKGRLAKSLTPVALAALPHISHSRYWDLTQFWGISLEWLWPVQHQTLDPKSCHLWQLNSSAKIKQSLKPSARTSVRLWCFKSLLHVFTLVSVQALLSAVSSKDLYLFLRHNAVHSSVDGSLMVLQA